MLSEVLSLELTASEKLHFVEGLVFLLRLSGILYKGMNYTLTTRRCNGLNCCLIASWGCELNARGLPVWGLHVLPVSVVSDFLPQPKSMLWIGRRRKCKGLYEVLLHVGHLCSWRRGWAPAPPTASLSAGEAVIENRWMTGWIWWTPDAGKNSPCRNKKSLTEKKHSRRILSPSSYMSPVFCPVSHVPRSCSPFWPFTSSSVWASLDCTRQLFVVWRNRLFSFSWGNRGCQHEIGSLQALCSPSQKIT